MYGEKIKRNTSITVLILVLVSISIGYAVISSSLNLNGNVEISKASWDIHFDNLSIKEGSIDSATAEISDDGQTITYTASLNNPGDYYEFFVDIVNEGTIDAMISEVTKSSLTSEQIKYLDYEVSYYTKDEIKVNDLLTAGKKEKIRVSLLFKTDIDATDLPVSGDTVTLSFSLNYVQADDKAIKVQHPVCYPESGDGTKLGDQITCGTENFYVISNDGTNIEMLSKYNLYVGGYYETDNGWIEYGSEATGIQNSAMLATVKSESIFNGTVAFSETNYWYDTDNSTLKDNYGLEFPAYVYDENSKLYIYIQNYEEYLKNNGVSSAKASLMSLEKAISLGCDKITKTCVDAPEWVYSTSYWLGTAYNENGLADIYTTAHFGTGTYSGLGALGVRPLININISDM